VLLCAMTHNALSLSDGRSVQLGAGQISPPSPLLGLLGEPISVMPQVDKPRLHLGIGDAGIDLLIELLDDLGWCGVWCADAESSSRWFRAPLRRIMEASFAAKLRRGSTRTCSAACFRRALPRCVRVLFPSTGSGHRKFGNATGRGRRCTDATWRLSRPDTLTINLVFGVQLNLSIASVDQRNESLSQGRPGKEHSSTRTRWIFGRLSRGVSDMGRAVFEEVATLASLALFLGMVAIWAQVIATL
jgi:hypothetical protein